jgi:hypothetical protein
MARTNGGLVQGKWDCQTLRFNQRGGARSIIHSILATSVIGTASGQRMDVVNFAHAQDQPLFDISRHFSGRSA